LALPTYYNTGTASVANGATTVTGGGTAWSGSIEAGDYFEAEGLRVRIASVDSNTQLTLAANWPGTTLSTDPYEIAITYGADVQLKTRQIIASMSDFSTWYEQASADGQSKLYLYEDEDNGENFATLQPPASLTGNRVWTGPDADMTFSAFMAGLMDDADAAALLTSLGISAFVQTILNDADAPATRTTIGAAASGANTDITSITPTQIDVGTYSTSGVTNGKQLTSSALFSSRSSTAGQNHAVFNNPNGQVGSIATSASATVYNTSSDYRLKCDVAPLVSFSLSEEDFDLLPDCLRLILSVEPVAHRWMADPDGPISHGFIAHELQRVFPHAVTGEKDAVEDIGTVEVAGPDEAQIVAIDVTEDRLGEIAAAAGLTPDDVVWRKTGTRIIPQGVDYSKLVADLTASVQALTLIVLEQQKRIEALEG
jgi:hypothetical protein